MTHVSSQTDLQLKLYFGRGEWIMGIETSYLRQAAYALKGAMGSAEEIEKIVINHSLGAAASAVASGWIPGAGGVVASVLMRLSQKAWSLADISVRSRPCAWFRRLSTRSRFRLLLPVVSLTAEVWPLR